MVGCFVFDDITSFLELGEECFAGRLHLGRLLEGVFS